MDHGFTQRRQAKAVAISQSIEAQRKAVMARVLLAIGGSTLVVEALILVEKVWSVSHP